MHWRTTLGLIVTFAYLVVLVALTFSGWSELSALRPNEIGDALAGAFAPLAFLWLIIGYFQASDELNQNTKALRLQEKELRNQVEETRKLVEVEREKLDRADEAARLQAQPRLVWSGGSGDGRSWKLEFTNEGGPAWGLLVGAIGADVELSLKPTKHLDTGKEATVLAPPDLPEESHIEISYRDQRGDPGATRFVYIGGGRCRLAGQHEIEAGPPVYKGGGTDP